MLLKILIFTYLTIFSLNLYSAKIFLYLNIENSNRDDLKLKIDKITFYNKDLKSYKVHIKKQILSNIVFKQIFLKKFFLPSGLYTKLAINDKINIPINLKIGKNETQCLFLIWNIKSSFENGKFKPKLFFKKQIIPLRGEILFVTSEKDDVLFLIRLDKNQVSYAITVNDSPTEISLSCFQDKIYILTKKSKTIYVIEASTLRIIDSYLLPYVNSPEFLTKTSNSLIVIDPLNNKVISINKDTGNLINTLQVGDLISDVENITNSDNFLIASKNEHIIYMLNDNLQILKQFKTNCAPQKIYIKGNFVYVLEPNCNYIEIFNLENGKVIKKMRAISPFDMIYINSKIFIANHSQKQLDIFYSNQFFSSKRIPVSINPFKIISCKRRGWIYTISTHKKYIDVIDIGSEKLFGKIYLGAIPYDLKVGRTVGCK